MGRAFALLMGLLLSASGIALIAQDSETVDTVGTYTFELIQEVHLRVPEASMLTIRPEIRPPRTAPVHSAFRKEIPLPSWKKDWKPLPPLLPPGKPGHELASTHSLFFWGGYPLWVEGLAAGTLSHLLPPGISSQGEIRIVYRENPEYTRIPAFSLLAGASEISGLLPFQLDTRMDFTWTRYPYLDTLPLLFRDSPGGIPAGDSSLQQFLPRRDIYSYRLWMRGRWGRRDVSRRLAYHLSGEGFFTVWNLLTEWRGKLLGEMRKQLQSPRHLLGARLWTEALSHGGFTRQGIAFAGVGVYYEYTSRQGLLVHIGAMPVAGPRFYLLPDIYSQHWFIPGILGYFTEMTGFIQTLSLSRLMEEQPYFMERGLNLFPSDHLVSRVGVRFAPVRFLVLQPYFEYRRIRAFRMWILADSTTPVMMWKPIYDPKTEILGLHLRLELDAPYVQGGLRAGIYDFRLSEKWNGYEVRVPIHYPRWDLEGNLRFQLEDLLHLRLGIRIYGDRTVAYLQPSGSPEASPALREQRESFAGDVSLAVYWRIAREWMLGIRIFNLIGTQYTIWFPYRATGPWIQIGFGKQWFAR